VRRQLVAVLAAVVAQRLLGVELLDHLVRVDRDQHVANVRLLAGDGEAWSGETSGRAGAGGIDVQQSSDC